MNRLMREAVRNGESWVETVGSRIAHTSAERLGSESGGIRLRDHSSRRERARPKADHVRLRKGRASDARTATVTRSVNRGEQTTGGAIEREPFVLPGRALTESGESLHVTPDGARVRLVLFRQRIGVERSLVFCVTGVAAGCPSATRGRVASEAVQPNPCRSL